MDETTGGRVENSGKAVRKPIDPFLRELMKERNELKSEMAFLKEKQTKTVRQIKELEAHVQRIPAAEQRLTILVRDYENLQKGYQSLLDKRTNARILENYESRQFGEQYRVIEPANLPAGEEPPTLLHFLLGGLVLGCIAGLGGAIGVELVKVRDPPCRGSRELSWSFCHRLDPSFRQGDGRNGTEAFTSHAPWTKKRCQDSRACSGLLWVWKKMEAG